MKPPKRCAAINDRLCFAVETSAAHKFKQLINAAVQFEKTIFFITGAYDIGDRKFLVFQVLLNRVRKSDTIAVVLILCASFEQIPACIGDYYPLALVCCPLPAAKSAV